MFKGARKEDYKSIANELGLSNYEKLTIYDLINLIKDSDKYKDNPELVGEIASNIIEERKSEELKQCDIEKLKIERAKLELELARVRAETKTETISGELDKKENLESLDSLIKSVRTLTIKIPSKPEGWGYFFSSLERAFVTKNVPEKYKSEILLNLLGERATNVITYIKDDELSDYLKVKAIVIREFEPTPQICLENFRKTQRQPNETYMQFASRLVTSWEYYLKLKNVSDFETLKELIVSDKICQTLDKDVSCFINVRQNNSWFKPTELAKEIDLYFTSRGKSLTDNSVVNKNIYSKNTSRVFFNDANSVKCILECCENHPLYKCPVYKKMPISERVQLVKINNLCFNCLMNHKVQSCKSKLSCIICRKKHHVTLHFPRDQKVSKAENTAECGGGNQTRGGRNMALAHLSAPEFIPLQTDNNLVSPTCNVVNNSKAVLLSTFICLISDECGNLYPIRGLLDVGANSNFISNRLVEQLNLRKEKINISVSGLNEISLNVKSKVNALIKNRNKNYAFESRLDFLVVPRITDLTPSRSLEISGAFLKNVNLADENFNVPGNIDILLGAEKFYELLLPGQIYPPNTKLILQNSVFGYIVSGSLPVKGENSVHCGLITDNNELEKTIKSFWEIENIERESEISKSKELEICEKYFRQTFSRNTDGRYIVKMPFKEEPSCLGESKQKALNCLSSLYKRLSREKEIYSLYKLFMNEYLNMGHMEEVIESSEPNIKYYIPHHAVVRPESSSTPLRVVFNASSATTTGKSLNCLQYVGGVIQDDLFSILIRFRKHQFAFVADIKKMYRMILIDPEQRDLLRILWKDENSAEVKTFRLCTISYGTSSAPYLATRVLKQLVNDEGKQFPLAAPVLLSDVYMDDIVTGADSIIEARELQTQLILLLEKACMELHKWSANHPSLLCNNPKSTDYVFSSEIKTLGIVYKPQLDCFSFNLDVKQESVYTKRTVLSQIAKIFDPLGLIGPIITRAKVFLQKLWLLKIDWHDNLPVKENAEWNNFIDSLQCVNKISISRFILTEQSTVIELHGFADASEVAYGAAIYVKSRNSSGASSVKLLTSKSRVAPLKCVTIPRLELSAAVLLTKLMKKVGTALKQEIANTYYYTDSTIVLSWLRKEPHDLKTFVANRVSIIQNLTLIEQWLHISSKNNPADIISRGLDPNQLEQCDLWWYGPSCIHHEEFTECGDSCPSPNNDELFLREIKSSDQRCALVTNVEPLDIVNNCSSVTKIQRVIAWCRRFIHNTRNPLNRVTGSLTSCELSESLLCVVKNIQRLSFVKEIQCLEKGTQLPNNSKLLNLCPFLDSNGILRVGGRLKNSNLTIHQKHPMILPTKHHFTIVLINHYHILYLHAGAELTLSMIRQRFWIVAARNIIRKILWNCVACKKVSSKPGNQLMADLPAARVQPTRVFSVIGIDYCGPFNLKYFSGRFKKVNKVYVCTFVCFSTKALHFEIVYDLTTSAFLGALKRFISRRGKPSEIFSDNGRNFVGANNELREILKNLFNLKSKEEIENYLATEGIKWHFNPPSSPHFGGLWEASVKSLKYHLKRVIGNNVLTYEEFLTLVTQIEALLNSRPLCPLSNDPNDLEALTPAHFIIGSSLVALPEPDYSEIPMNRLSRWQLVQKLKQQLWKKWSSEYLNKLIYRPKWYRGNVEIKKGDLILEKNSFENNGFLKWNLARVIETHPGKDGVIRVVSLKNKFGAYKRPITKIAILPHVN